MLESKPFRPNNIRSKYFYIRVYRFFEKIQKDNILCVVITLLKKIKGYKLDLHYKGT